MNSWVKLLLRLGQSKILYSDSSQARIKFWRLKRRLRENNTYQRFLLVVGFSLVACKYSQAIPTVLNYPRVGSVQELIYPLVVVEDCSGLLGSFVSVFVMWCFVRPWVNINIMTIWCEYTNVMKFMMVK